MNKRILLCDVDSTIPNLALAKLSTHHKKMGDDVTLLKGLNISSKLDNWNTPWDEVYISCVFSRNKQKVEKLRSQFPNSKVHVGGSGFDLVTELPPEIECLMPDYDLYPNWDYSMGFSSRGCIRHCEFCVVPEKEGKIRAVADIYQFWNPKHKKIVFLDNNILALPDHFKKIAEQLNKENLRLDVNQAMDIRLVNEENAKILADLKFDPYMRFSWDNIKIEPQVRRGIQLLKDAGVKAPALFYILIGFDSTFEEDLHRANVLRELGQKCFMMQYNGKVIKEKRYNYLVNWCNGKMHWWSRTYDEYVAGKENGKQKQMAAENRKQKLIENTHGKDINEFIGE